MRLALIAALAASISACNPRPADKTAGERESEAMPPDPLAELAKPISASSSSSTASSVPRTRVTGKDAFEEFLESVDADTMVMVPMRDGVRLATDVYRSKDAKGRLPTVFWRTPYNVNKLSGRSLELAKQLTSRGYAFIVQNERGRYYSEGDWEILGRPRTDGYDALTWIADQPWSNGKVGTIGCSSSAEWQLALAAKNHPAHAAMIPMAAGAGIGRVGGFYEQGNWYKGGVHQTLFAVWLYGVQQNTRPQFPKGLTQADLQRLRRSYDLAARMPQVDWKKQLNALPMTSWLDGVGGNTGPFVDLLQRTPDDPRWYEGGLYHDTEDFGVPALWLNSWYDVSQGPNLALFNHIRSNASDKEVRDGQYVIIAPTKHCGFFDIPKGDLIVGERNMGNASLPLDELVFGWFDYWLRGKKNRQFMSKLPRVYYYTMGLNRYQSAKSWPPENASPVPVYLTSNGEANSVFGDGKLSFEPAAAPAVDRFPYDPTNPVPALGGGICCNADAALGGSYDQRGIEARHDVLVYTSEPLDEDMEVTGSVHATLYVSSDAKDTDFTVKLVDVHPDGTAYNVDDTIQRARYREGYKEPRFMEKGQVYEIGFSPMSTSNLFKRGHRIRVEVSSSKFPQYMRNLNTGGNNFDETESVIAQNAIHHSGEHRSRVVLPVVKRAKRTVLTAR